MPDQQIDIQAAMQPMAQCVESCGDGILQLHDELNRFVVTRIAHTTEALSEIGKNGANLAATLDIQQRFFATAIRDCQDSTQRLFVISGRIMQGMFEPEARR